MMGSRFHFFGGSFSGQNASFPSTCKPIQYDAAFISNVLNKIQSEAPEILRSLGPSEVFPSAPSVPTITAPTENYSFITDAPPLKRTRYDYDALVQSNPFHQQLPYQSYQQQSLYSTNYTPYYPDSQQYQTYNENVMVPSNVNANQVQSYNSGNYYENYYEAPTATANAYTYTSAHYSTNTDWAPANQWITTDSTHSYTINDNYYVSTDLFSHNDSSCVLQTTNTYNNNYYTGHTFDCQFTSPIPVLENECTKASDGSSNNSSWPIELFIDDDQKLKIKNSTGVCAESNDRRQKEYRSCRNDINLSREEPHTPREKYSLKNSHSSQDKNYLRCDKRRYKRDRCDKRDRADDSHSHGHRKKYYQKNSHLHRSEDNVHCDKRERANSHFYEPRKECCSPDDARHNRRYQPNSHGQRKKHSSKKSDLCQNDNNLHNDEGDQIEPHSDGRMKISHVHSNSESQVFDRRRGETSIKDLREVIQRNKLKEKKSQLKPEDNAISDEEDCVLICDEIPLVVIEDDGTEEEPNLVGDQNESCVQIPLTSIKLESESETEEECSFNNNQSHVRQVQEVRSNNDTNFQIRVPNIISTCDAGHQLVATDEISPCPKDVDVLTPNEQESTHSVDCLQDNVEEKSTLNEDEDGNENRVIQMQSGSLQIRLCCDVTACSNEKEVATLNLSCTGSVDSIDMENDENLAEYACNDVIIPLCDNTDDEVKPNLNIDVQLAEERKITESCTCTSKLLSKVELKLRAALKRLQFLLTKTDSKSTTREWLLQKIEELESEIIEPHMCDDIDLNDDEHQLQKQLKRLNLLYAIQDNNEEEEAKWLWMQATNIERQLSTVRPHDSNVEGMHSEYQITNLKICDSSIQKVGNGKDDSHPPCPTAKEKEYLEHSQVEKLQRSIRIQLEKLNILLRFGFNTKQNDKLLAQKQELELKLSNLKTPKFEVDKSTLTILGEPKCAEIDNAAQDHDMEEV